jgi:hypothetical protein
MFYIPISNARHNEPSSPLNLIGAQLSIYSPSGTSSSTIPSSNATSFLRSSRCTGIL